ncbi:MAG: 7-carboxy-7-deazaguanine synthase [Candidatus Atribacteria bacterium ADurb.Bin276]|uniref:7-carboxy-7-deazaguanine synthase n=1 Tax=Candidatus Atribacter allofermentans TaxID=1852833 RepID=A0A1V5SVG5_9BACT|nr:MAG: 7-carboxy-7-deazaguanine synthase [Candidatus Atribacteria bacterium ADurb.Bin276]
MKSIKLIECMNFTWQAEGDDCGKKMLLTRFKYCNRAHGYLEENGLHPCPFCDTITKMKIETESDYYIKDLQMMIEENNLALMISGGEPGFGLNLQSNGQSRRVHRYRQLLKPHSSREERVERFQNR